jgi:transcriptional regulator with XRE-family HTH domain
VVAARNELRLSQEEFAARGSIGLKTVQRIEGGKVVPRGKTLTSLDDASGWPSGTARAIYERDAPRPPSVPPQATRPILDREAGEVDEREALRRMIEIVPSIRRHYGAEQADLLVGRIMTLAVKSNLVDFASSELQAQANDAGR